MRQRAKSGIMASRGQTFCQPPRNSIPWSASWRGRRQLSEVWATPKFSRVVEVWKRLPERFSLGARSSPRSLRGGCSTKSEQFLYPSTVLNPRKTTECPVSFFPTASVQKIFKKSPGRAVEKSVKLCPSPSSWKSRAVPGPLAFQRPQMLSPSGKVSWPSVRSRGTNASQVFRESEMAPAISKAFSVLRKTKVRCSGTVTWHGLLGVDKDGRGRINRRRKRLMRGEVCCVAASFWHCAGLLQDDLVEISGNCRNGQDSQNERSRNHRM